MTATPIGIFRLLAFLANLNIRHAIVSGSVKIRDCSCEAFDVLWGTPGLDTEHVLAVDVLDGFVVKSCQQGSLGKELVSNKLDDGIDIHCNGMFGAIFME
jgi:hypothetical protein